MTLQVTTIEDDDDGTVGELAPPTRALRVATDHDELGDAAVRDLLRLIETNRRLQEALAANAALSEQSLMRLLDGTAPGDVLDDVDVAGSRTMLFEAMVAFERARHQSRSTFICAQFEGGMNMKEIGRRWGISRQLAHRSFAEARRNI